MPFCKRLTSLLLTLTLLACGGGDGTSDTPPLPPLPPAPVAGAHRVDLNANADRINIEIVEQPGLNLPEISAAPGQAFAASVAPEWENHVLLLRLRQSDLRTRSSDHPEVETGDGSLGTTVAYLLATGRDLNRGSVSFNPLTDYITRRLLEYRERFTPEQLRHYQDELARAFVEHDLTGDGVIDYADVLAFNPAQLGHTERLTFDYAQAMGLPMLDGGRSLQDVYAAYPQDAAASTPEGSEPAAPTTNPLNDALLEVFDPLESIPLPDPAQMPVALMVLDADQGGSITVEEIPGLQLDHSNPRLIRRADITTPPQALTLRAHADTGMRFVRWVGCPQVNANGSCTVLATGDQAVGAQFGLAQDVLMPDVPGVIKLGHAPEGSYEVEMDGAGVLSVYGIQDAALAHALAAATPGHVLATLNWRFPLLRITQVLPPTQGRFRFATEAVEPEAVYQALSTFETGREPTVDDVYSIQVAPGDEAQPTTLKATGSQPGSAPSRRVWVEGYGPGVDAGSGFYLVKNPQGSGFIVVNAPGGSQELQGSAALKAIRSDTKAGKDAPIKIPLGEFGVGGFDPKKPDQKYAAVGKFTPALEIGLANRSSSLQLLWSVLPPDVGLDMKGNLRATLQLGVMASAFLGWEVKDGYIAGIAAGQCGKGKEVKASTPSGTAESMAKRSTAMELDADDPFGQAGAALGNATDLSFCYDTKTSATTTGAITLFTPKAIKVSLQLNETTPDGLVAPLKLNLGLNMQAKGKAGFSADWHYRYNIPFDVDVDIGHSCQVRGSSTYCGKWKKPQRLETHAKGYANTKFSLAATVNAELAPSADLTLTWGPRSVSEDLVTLGAGVSLPLTSVGNYGKYVQSNFPDDIYKMGEDACSFSSGVALGLSLRTNLYAKVVPDFKVAKINFKFDEWKLFESPSEISIISPKFFSPSHSWGASSQAACKELNQRPEALFPGHIDWRPGELNWDTPKRVMTRYYQLELTKDGDFVLSRLIRQSGTISAIQTVWRTGTEGHPGARVAFTKSGYLNVYDVRNNLIFSSACFSNMQNREGMLRLQAYGNGLAMFDSYSRGGSPIWGINTQGAPWPKACGKK